jgi:hydroxyacylglutathione hydrolase
MRPYRRRILIFAAAIGLMAAFAASLAPYISAEYMFDVRGGVPSVLPKPSAPLSGRWVDDYFVVEPIDSATFAIGEPRYYQGNYSYLILGDRRAILFDAGSGLRDIVPVARALTSLEITVIPSHLHFDHVGALGRLDRTALIDDPSLRARIVDSRLTLRRYEFLGFADRRQNPTFRVDEWWPADSMVDLGGRKLRVLATPGHTPTSISLYDEDSGELFAGDYIYPGELYAFLPGASRSAYLATTRRLLATLQPTTRIFAAHMDDPTVAVKAPVLEVGDLSALARALERIDQGTPASSGFYPRVFSVTDSIKFATGWPWNNR